MVLGLREIKPSPSSDGFQQFFTEDFFTFVSRELHDGLVSTTWCGDDSQNPTLRRFTHVLDVGRRC
jgi:hypothetical protein